MFKIDTKVAVVGAVVIVFLAYDKVIRPYLEALQVLDTKEEKEADEVRKKTENQSIQNDYWNPSYYQNRPVGMAAKILTTAYADALAKTIYSATGFFNDNEEKIYGAFRALQYKTQVSFLATRFFALYKKDLYTYLRDKVLNREELDTVLKITNKLPTGYFK
jgi:hypothetical protein